MSTQSLSEWRYNRGKMKPGAKLKDVFPDVEKTVIAKTFKARTGTNVGDVVLIVDPRYFVTSGGGAMAADASTKTIKIDSMKFEVFYPGEWKYLGIVHELAHIMEHETKYGLYDEAVVKAGYHWEEVTHEADAIYWSGMQAARMGYDREDFKQFVKRRYGDFDYYQHERIVEAGLGPLARRPNVHSVGPPIFVSRYRRKRSDH